MLVQLLYFPLFWLNPIAAACVCVSVVVNVTFVHVT